MDLFIVCPDYRSMRTMSICGLAFVAVLMLKKAQAPHPGKTPIPFRTSRENGLENIESGEVTGRRRMFSHPAAVLR